MKKVFTREEIENLAFDCRNDLVKKEALQQFFSNWEGLDSLDIQEWIDDTDDLTNWNKDLDRELDFIFAKKWMTEIEDQLDKELLDADE